MLLTSLLLATAQPATPTRNRAAERALFEKIVEMQTVAGKPAEFRKLTALLTAEFRKAGMTTIVKDHDNTQTLIARWKSPRPSGKKPILLMAHMDVVEAKASDWKNPPFEFREEGGYYLGRGASDNKSDMTGVLLALQYLKDSGLQPSRDIIFLITGDEETVMGGARRAVTEWRDLIEAEYAINADGGGGSLFADGRVESFVIQVAEKTYADYKLVATNRGGHSSAPRPDNAIYALTGALKALETHRFMPKVSDANRAQFAELADKDKGRMGELVRLWLANPQNRERADQVEAMLPGYTRTRCVATMLSAGHAPNALPQRAEANVNCRIFPGEKVAAVQTQLQALAGPDVVVSVDEASLTPEAEATPMRADLLEAVKAALAMRFNDATVIPFMSAGATDGSYLRAAGIPVYGFGARWGIIGQPQGAHGLDERVLIDGFHGQIPIWMELLRRLAS